MKSISSLSVMILIIMNNIIVNGTECLPNGCFYDLSVDLTKKIQCKPDGSLEILHYHGNNGCDNDEFYLSHLTYNSPVQNSCCEPDEPLICYDSWQCDPDQYCITILHTCVDNPCSDGRIHPFCVDDSICDDGCACMITDNVVDDDGVPLGICEPRLVDEEEELESTQYSITVINKSGVSANIGIFETNPSDTEISGGYPVVFAAQPTASGPGASTRFAWTLDWGLTWSDKSYNQCVPSPEEAPTIIYSRTGEIIPVSPTNPGNNGASITYANGVYDISAVPNSNLMNQLQLSTDDSFTTIQAENGCLILLVTLDDNPVFAIDGKPNMKMTYDISPTYYLSTTLNKKGATISAQGVSQSFQVVFAKGENHKTVCLDKTNTFYYCTTAAPLPL